MTKLIEINLDGGQLLIYVVKKINIYVVNKRITYMSQTKANSHFRKHVIIRLIRANKF